MCRYLITPFELITNVSGIPYTPQSIAIRPFLSTGTSEYGFPKFLSHWIAYLGLSL